LPVTGTVIYLPGLTGVSRISTLRPWIPIWLSAAATL